MRPSGSQAAAWNVLTGTAAKYALLAVNIVVGVILMPFTVGKLGKADYGLWMMVASMTGYFQLLDLGYGSGLVRHITEADARGDERAVNEVASTFVIVYLLIGLVAGTAAAVLALVVLPSFPGLSHGQSRTATLIMLVLGTRAAIGFPMTVFGAVTTSRQYFALNTTIAIVVSLLSAAATYFVLDSGYGLVPLVCTTTAISLLAYVAYARAALVAYPGLRIRTSLFSRARLRDVTSFSLYLFVIDIATQIGFNLDNLVVGAFLGTSAVAVYAVASRLADYQRQLCNQFNGLLFPVVVGFDARGNAQALRSMLEDGTRLAFGLVVGVTICLVGFGDPLVRSWMGAGFVDSLWPLYILAVAGIVLVGQGPLGNILLGTGRHRLVASASIFEALVNLALSVWFVRYWGVAGVALGTAIPVVAVNLLVLMPAACRALGVPIGTFLRHAGVPALTAAAPAALAAAALRFYAPPSSFAWVILEGTLAGLVYAVTFVGVGLGPLDRVRYLGYAKRLTPRARARAAATVISTRFHDDQRSHRDIQPRTPAVGVPAVPRGSGVRARRRTDHRRQRIFRRHRRGRSRGGQSLPRARALRPRGPGGQVARARRGAAASAAAKCWPSPTTTSSWRLIGWPGSGTRCRKQARRSWAERCCHCSRRVCRTGSTSRAARGTAEWARRLASPTTAQPGRPSVPARRWRATWPSGAPCSKKPGASPVRSARSGARSSRARTTC